MRQDRTRRVFAAIGLAAALLAAACGGDDDNGADKGGGDTGGGDTTAVEADTSTTAAAADGTTTTAGEAEGGFGLESAAFAEGEAIPQEFTCDGANTSPPLTWSGVPDGTVELALVVDDPDAPGGSFIHWVIWKLDPSGSIEAGTPPEDAREGTNDSGGTSWFGPCPPEGVHHYRFELHALSGPADLPAGATTAPDLRDTIADLTIATTVLTGTYER